MAGLRQFAIGVAAVVLAPPTAAADDPRSAAARTSSPIEEIIVTATRRDTPVRDVPFNVAALSGEALDRLRVSDLHDLSAFVPGLVVVDQGLRAASRMPVRGLNVASLNESPVLFNSGGGTVATYVGDVPVHVDLRLRDIERVEVLLGPQGTMYGAGTLGGAIRYIPRSPDATAWQAAISVSGFGQSESDGTGSDVWGVLNVPLIEERLALRVSASRYDDPGFIDYPFLLREPGLSDPNPDFGDAAEVDANLRRENDVDAGIIVGARAGLLWTVSESLSVNAAFHFQETEFGGRPVNHRHALGTGRYESAHRIPEPNSRRNEIASLDIAADLGFAELVSITGATIYREFGQRDGTDLGLAFEIGLEDFPEFVTIARDKTDEERFNQELRLVSTSDGAWDWIAGAYYNRYEFSHAFSELAPGYAEFLDIERPDGLLSVILLEEDLEELALFGELGRQLTNRWRVSAGARRFHSSRRSGNATDFPLFNTLDGAGPDEINVDTRSFDFDDDGTLFKLSSSVDLNDDLLAYVTVSEGYRLGGVNPFPRCPAPIGCLRPDEVQYVPDSTLNYELGVKGSLFAGDVYFSAAAYHIDWRDIQLDTISEDLFFIKVNGGKARSRGIELVTEASLTDRLRGSVTYALNRAELTAFAAGVVDGVADGMPGDRLPGTPEHQAALRFDYAVPLPRGRDVELGYTLTATSGIHTKVGLRNGGEVLPGYALHNISATFRSRDDWAIRVFVDNLFDKFAETNTRTDPGFIRNVGVHPLRSYFRNVAPPRRYGVEIRYDFGSDS